MISRLKDTLLLVSDDAQSRAQLREIFQSSFNYLEAENLYQAALLLEQNQPCIASVLVDMSCVEEDGVRLVNEAACMGSDTAIPIVCFVDAADNGIQEELAFSWGASDVVSKQSSPVTILRRVNVLVDLHLHKWHLQTLVKEQREIIRNTNQVMLDALSAIIEHRNTESGNHVLRIRRFTRVLLEDVAKNCPEYGLTEADIETIAGAAALHDIGKISIPDAILNKPGKLTPAEYEAMKNHTVVGGGLIQNLSGMGDTEFLRYAYNIAMYHHERWDGNGYPHGLTGEEIPLCAQVVGIADVFDALTSQRVYKPALPFDQAINMILNRECGEFSPKILECFKHVRTQFMELARQYADGHSPKDDAITIANQMPNWQASPLNTAQLSLVKYQTVLHHMNDTVIELDLAEKLLHVVYNPNPDLDRITSASSFENVADLVGRFEIHPEDSGILEYLRVYMAERFFQQSLRRKTFTFRMYSHTLEDWQRYELTFLRVNTGNTAQHIVISVWHRCAGVEFVRPEPEREMLLSAQPLQDLTCSTLRCLADEDMTIAAGRSTLCKLTGYTQEEIASNFDNKLLRMVDPRDRDSFYSDARKHLEQGGRVEYQVRLLQKDQEPCWVLIRSRTSLERDGQEYFYHAIWENSGGKNLELELRNAIQRNQIIVEQSGGIVFEWDQKSDTMYCSPKWKERFGYTPVSKNYGSQMGIATHFHPDDLPLVRGAVEQIRSQKGSISIDVRIADSNAQYLWTRIAGTAYLDEDNNLSRIIGILQDVDELKRAELALRERAERDALTKLFNKTSGMNLVTEYLAHRAEGTLAAMLILDLDNFKAVNDNYGHLYGDALLDQVANTLRQMFRSNDVLVRVGGDEFMILMRDVPDAELVNGRCQRLLQTMRPMLEKTAPGHNVSCSVGVALVPQHGTTYSELFRRADEALYVAKSMGKNRYIFYDPMQNLTPIPTENIRATTSIDSDHQPGMANASFVHFVFRRLYESGDVTAALDEILGYIGEQLNVSRVYIFENNDDNTTCSNTFEWCNEGIAPEKEHLQNISYLEDIQGWPSVFDERGVFYCTDISKLEPHFRAVLEPQGIKSMLQCAILDGGVFRGYVGFDECSVHRMWTKDQIDLLQMLAEVLALFLLKQRVKDQAVTQSEDLRSILDHQNAWIYVIDPESCRLKFLNSKALELAPEGAVGGLCYEVFMNRRSRCENCPAINIYQDENREVIIDNYNEKDLRVYTRATQISWKGERACLISCMEYPSNSVEQD